MKRRTFIRNSVGASTALSVLGYSAISCTSESNKVLDEPTQVNTAIGIQLYTLAAVLGDNFEGTLKMLADTGYKKLEFAGPYYFSPQEEIDNNILIQQMGLKGFGYYNNTPSELKAILDKHGLTAPSAHVSMLSIEHNLDEVLNAAKTIGHQYITIPMMIKSTMDEWKATADQFNEIGDACKNAGVGFAYHNHSQEFAIFDGEVIMDMLLNRTDPDLVSFEVDIFWTTVAGINVAEYLEKYPGRFKMVHIKDMATEMETPNTDWQVFTDSEKAMAIIGNQTIIGEGVIDYTTILKQVKNAGIEHFFIESDFPPEPVVFAQESFSNVKTMLS